MPELHLARDEQSTDRGDIDVNLPISEYVLSEVGGKPPQESNSSRNLSLTNGEQDSEGIEQRPELHRLVKNGDGNAFEPLFFPSIPAAVEGATVGSGNASDNDEFEYDAVDQQIASDPLQQMLNKFAVLQSGDELWKVEKAFLGGRLDEVKFAAAMSEFLPKCNREKLSQIFRAVDARNLETVSWADVTAFCVEQALVVERTSTVGVGDAKFEVERRFSCTGEIKRPSFICAMPDLNNALLVLDGRVGKVGIISLADSLASSVHTTFLELSVRGRALGIMYAVSIGTVLVVSAGGDLCTLDPRMDMQHTLPLPEAGSLVLFSSIHNLAIVPSGNGRLFTVSVDRGRTGKLKAPVLINNFRVRNASVGCATLNQKNGIAICGCGDASVIAISFLTGTILWTCHKNTSVLSVAFSPDQNCVALVDLSNIPSIHSAHYYTNPSMAKDKATMNTGGVFELYDVSMPHKAPVRQMMFVSGTTNLLTMDETGLMKIWDTRTIRCRRSLMLAGSDVGGTFSCLTVFDSNRLFASNRVSIVELRRLDQQQSQGLKGAVIRIVHSKLQNSFIAASFKEIRQWSLKSGALTCVTTTQELKDEISSVCVDREGRRLCIGKVGGGVSVHSAVTCYELYNFPDVHNGEVLQVCMMDHAKCVVSLGADNRLAMAPVPQLAGRDWCEGDLKDLPSQSLLTDIRASQMVYVPEPNYLLVMNDNTSNEFFIYDCRATQFSCRILLKQKAALPISPTNMLSGAGRSVMSVSGILSPSSKVHQVRSPKEVSLLHPVFRLKDSLLHESITTPLLLSNARQFSSGTFLSRTLSRNFSDNSKSNKILVGFVVSDRVSIYLHTVEGDCVYCWNLEATSSVGGEGGSSSSSPPHSSPHNRSGANVTSVSTRNDEWLYLGDDKGGLSLIEVVGYFDLLAPPARTPQLIKKVNVCVGTVESVVVVADSEVVVAGSGDGFIYVFSTRLQAIWSSEHSLAPGPLIKHRDPPPLPNSVTHGSRWIGGLGEVEEEEGDMWPGLEAVPSSKFHTSQSMRRKSATVGCDPPISALSGLKGVGFQRGASIRRRGDGGNEKAAMGRQQGKDNSSSGDDDDVPSALSHESKSPHKRRQTTVFMSQGSNKLRHENKYASESHSVNSHSHSHSQSFDNRVSNGDAAWLADQLTVLVTTYKHRSGHDPNAPKTFTTKSGVVVTYGHDPYGEAEYALERDTTNNSQNNLLAVATAGATSNNDTSEGAGSSFLNARPAENASVDCRPRTNRLEAIQHRKLQERGGRGQGNQAKLLTVPEKINHFKIQFAPVPRTTLQRLPTETTSRNVVLQPLRMVPGTLNALRPLMEANLGDKVASISQSNKTFVKRMPSRM